jgi:hypothetical protein
MYITTQESLNRLHDIECWENYEELLQPFQFWQNETHTAYTSNEAPPVYTCLLIIPSKTKKKVMTTLKRGLLVSHFIQI